MHSRFITASIAAVFSIVFFGFFVMMYIPIFRENIQSRNNIKSQKIISKNNVLGENIPEKSESKNADELRMKSGALREESVSFGVAYDYSNKSNDLNFLMKSLNGKISSISIYKQFGLENNNSFSEDDINFFKSNNLKPIIAWEPWNPKEDMKQSTDFLKEIPLGLHDNYIRSFALSIKKFGNRVIIRFAHEMNGNWYPWGNKSSEFVKAYRHIVSIFESENVTNVQWMWCINAESVPVTPIENVKDFYPGDDVVDLIGIDGLNFGTTQEESTWRTFEEIFKPAYNYLQQYDKPIVIAETASSEIGGSKAEWVKGMFTSLPKYPKVTEIIWFNISKETDWPINSSDSSLEAFKEYL